MRHRKVGKRKKKVEIDRERDKIRTNKIEKLLIFVVRTLLIETGRIFGRIIQHFGRRDRIVVSVTVSRRAGVGGRAGILAGSGAPQLAHFVATLTHQHFILRNTHLLSVHDAGAFRTRPISIVRVLLHVQLRQSRLLLVVRLLVRIRHRFPACACVEQKNKTKCKKIYTQVSVPTKNSRSHRDLNSDRWIQSPEC